MMETHYPYSRYLRERFGETTYKVSVAGGMTCPTRDGKISSAGCAFCDLRGSSSFFGTQGKSLSVSEQLRRRLPEIRERFGARRFLAHFQSYTNTYAGIEVLERLYLEALSVEGMSGLCISTRPDCLPDPVIALLESLAKHHYVSLELGIQSFEDETLLWLKRGHDGHSSIDALDRLRTMAPSVDVCAHLIFGSPTDTPDMAKNSALQLNAAQVRGVKLHQLMILRGSKLADRWTLEPFSTLSLEQYATLVQDFLEHLSPSIYIERLCATASHQEECLAPEWSRGRWGPHNRIRAFLEQRGCRQGAKAKPMLK